MNEEIGTVLFSDSVIQSQIKLKPFFQLGTSPLHLAAQYGHHSTAEVLLRAGVSRDARTKVDRTPLHMAATEGHSSIVELLIRVRIMVSLQLYNCRETEKVYMKC